MNEKIIESFETSLNFNNLPTGTNSLIFLRGIKYIHLKSILEYIYLGATTIQNDSMKEFYDVAKDLELVEIYTNLVNQNEFISYFWPSIDNS